MSTVKPGKGVRLEGAILVLIVVSVGLAAGAASFTHVKEWTMANSPDGTGVWFGWANAIITELVPTASALAIRRRRRNNPHAPIGYPVTLMALAVAASLTAQLAVARPTPFGWIVSALPALAFLGLTRLVLHSNHEPTPTSVPVVSTTPPIPTPTIPAINPTPTVPAINPTPVPASAHTSTSDAEQVPADVRPVPPVVVATPADMPPRRQTPRPAPRPTESTPVSADARPSDPRPARPSIPAASLPASTTDTTTVTASEPAQPQLPGMDLAVLAQATRIAREHQRQHATAITAGQLAVALRISTTEASKVLTKLANDTTDRPVNGHTVTTATQ